MLVHPPAAKTIRILFVSDSIREPLTGVGRVAVTLMREFVALGAEITALDHEPNPAAERICGRVAILPCKGRGMRMGRWHLTLLRRIAGLGVAHDVLFDPTGYPNAFGHHSQQAILVHDLSMLEKNLYRRGKRAWFRLFYGRALRRAQRCICVSDHTRQQLLEQFALEPARCVVVPNSLDPTFRVEPEGGPHPQTPPSPYLLTVGTIEPRKNIARLLTAFKRADISHRLVLVGRPGHHAADLLTQAANLGDRILVLHDVDDDQLRHLYHGAEGLLFPSLDEGFGLPILEAMQSDVPVLTSNIAAMPEVAGDAALLVDPTDEDSIRTGIIRLVNDSDLRTRLITRGRANLERFRPRVIAERMLREFARLQP